MVILVESLLFMGAGAGAGEKPETVKKPGAGQKRAGSASLMFLTWARVDAPRPGW